MASATRRRIENLRERIDTSEEIGDSDRTLLLDFSNRLNLLAQDYSDYRHEKLLRHNVLISERFDGEPLTAALEDREAAERIVIWINQKYDNEETNRDYRNALRIFGKRLAETDSSLETNDDGIPLSLAWIPTGTSSNYDTSPDPRNMLKWDEHVVPMIEESYNARDKAMIALQFDAGLRGGEFKNLSVGDIQDHENGLQITVEGKQGRRTVLLIPSTPYLNRWLDAHPDREDPEAPLWSKLHSAEGLSDRMVGKIFKEAAGRAGVTKPVTLTNFRKSAAAFLASRNLNQAHIEDRQGWTRGSKAATRYISVFGGDNERELARLHGIDVSEEEPDSIAPLTCPRCDRETPRDESLCVWCGQALNPEAAIELESVNDDLQRTLAELTPEKAQQLVELSDALGDPEVRNALLDSE